MLVYEKTDDESNRTGNLNIKNTIFVDRSRTADFQFTKAILDALKREGNEDDLIALMRDRNLPVDDIEATSLAREILENAPEKGYLTISNALQWRLQYQRVIDRAGSVDGVVKVR